MEQNPGAASRHTNAGSIFPTALFLFLMQWVGHAEMQVLHSFEFGPQTPQAQLVQAADGNFYGVTSQGGAGMSIGGSGGGTLFRATPAGVITIMASFTGPNGSGPIGGLALVGGNTLYGTTQNGGAHGVGTVFSYVIGGALTTLFSFDGIAHGSQPLAGLTLGNDGALYGTTQNGGVNDFGAIFRITTAGGTPTVLYSFGATNKNPATALCLAPDGNFYGGTTLGPANGAGGTFGTLFRLTPGGVFTQLVGLTNDLGFTPSKRFAVGSDGAIYGTTSAGGQFADGTAFRLTTGGNYTVLASFSGPTGASAIGGLILGADANTNFYGTTFSGGANAEGTVFKLTVNTNSLTNSAISAIASFRSATNGGSVNACVTAGSDGKFYGVASTAINAFGCFYSTTTNISAISNLALFNNGGGTVPEAPPVLGPDGNFYGTTFSGGFADNGIIYRLTPGGTFTLLTNLGGLCGKNPSAPLCLGPDGAFYGTATVNGVGSGGTVFRVTTNGDLQTVIAFSNNITGSTPFGGLALGPDGNLYGTTQAGGTNTGTGVGTVFRLTPSGGSFIYTKMVLFVGTNGATPEGTLLNGGDGFIYGTTFAGGTNNNFGTVFRLNTNGAFNVVAYMQGTNGSQPNGGLVRGPDGAFYGSMFGSFSNGRGSYRVTTNGVLALFLPLPGNFGSIQFGTPVVGDGNIYSATYDGGPVSRGMLYRVDTNGNAGILSDMTLATGIQPYSVPAFGPDGALYGTTLQGGPGSAGTIYRFAFDRITGIQRSGTNMFITATGTTTNNYALYATTNLLSGSWTNIIGTVTATNSLATFTDTNAWKFNQRFYRTAVQ